MAHGLNPPQREAVSTLRGPLLVLAGAGTGKTRVVTYRIAELIRHGTPAERILAVTFTNKAAERNAAAGRRPAGQATARTAGDLHLPLALRAHPAAAYQPAGLSRASSPSTTGATRKASPARPCARSRWPTACCGRATCSISSAAGRSARSGPSRRPPWPRPTRSIWPRRPIAAIRTRLKAAGAVDFDDLLLCTEELLQRFPEVRQAEAGRFDHLLVDEYQDTNGSQYRIVKALAAGHRNLCVVGDDDQSIYGWRGAEVAHILRFKTDWPEAKVVRLEDNYRSTHEILAWPTG